MSHAIVLIFCYLLGSIPFGYLVGTWCSRVDIREHGSGNIGMSNVLRTTGYLPALITLVGDVGKGIIAVLVARYFIGDLSFSLIAGTFAVIGHNWPVFLQFKGGKGVATIAGVLLAYRPLAAAVLFILWFLVLLRYRYISLASIVAASSLPLLLLFFKVSWFEVLLGTIVGAFTVYRHRSNIERLRQGTEFRVGEKV